MSELAVQPTTKSTSRVGVGLRLKLQTSLRHKTNRSIALPNLSWVTKSTILMGFSISHYLSTGILPAAKMHAFS